VFFDCNDGGACLDVYRSILKGTFAKTRIPYKRLALSSSPSIETRHIAALMSTLSLEQIVCRSLDDLDVAPHLQAKKTYQVAVSGRPDRSVLFR
jgi:ERCC4-related helicase